MGPDAYGFHRWLFHRFCRIQATLAADLA